MNQHRHHPALLIHGGAGHRATAARHRRIRRHLRDICEEVHHALATRSALECVLVAVRRLEDDPLFNAGSGSVLQEDGRARMSASIMDGMSQRFAGVLNIERVRNPIMVARALLDQEDRVLDGAWAMKFARSIGCVSWNPVTPERLRQWRAHQRSPHGTVGAVALDGDGHLAAATSTGGKAFARPGRVSDSGLPVGNYANAQAAVSCTGIGEDIVEEGLAVRIAHRVLDGAPLPRAMLMVFREMSERQRRLAAIGVDRLGRLAWSTTLPVLLAVGCSRGRRVESF